MVQVGTECGLIEDFEVETAVFAVGVIFRAEYNGISKEFLSEACNDIYTWLLQVKLNKAGKGGEEEEKQKLYIVVAFIRISLSCLFVAILFDNYHNDCNNGRKQDCSHNDSNQ